MNRPLQVGLRYDVQTHFSLLRADLTSAVSQKFDPRVAQRLIFDTAWLFEEAVGGRRVGCNFRLTASCVGSRRVSATPGAGRPSGRQKPGEAIADAFVEKMSIVPRSPFGAPPRWLRNSGVESPQQKGDSPWTRAHLT